MKELSIEEKAKAYDEAIEKAKNCLKDGTITNTAISYIGTIFPELKESEDEKIRACIGMCLTDIDEQRFADFNTNLKECRDWLEEQGEQKPQGKSALEATNEEKVDNANKVEPKQEKLTEFEKAVKQVMEEAIECGDTRNLKADAEMLLSLVHNSSWSEEDEKLINSVIELIDDGALDRDEKDYFIGKLNFLKERYTWKPSDEQMETLENVRKILHSNKEIYSKINHFMFNFEELIRTLKKLREE